MAFKGNFIWVIAILVLAFLVASSITNSSKNQLDNKVTDRLTGEQRANISSGDIGVKIILSGINSKLSKQYRPIAYKNYKQALPSPQALRRLGVFEETILKRSGDKWFNLISKAKHLKSKKYIIEQKMWLDLFSSANLSISKSNEYESRIDDLDLGPLKNLALAQLFEKSRQNDKLHAVEKIASSNSYVAVCLIVIACMIAVFGCFIGIFLLIRFIVKKDSYSNKINVGTDESNNLLEGFVFYIISFPTARYLLNYIYGNKFADNKSNNFSLILQIAISIAALLIGIYVYSSKKNCMSIASKKLFGVMDFVNNIKWGIGGYLSLVPLMYVSFLLSGMIFSGYKTMEHPLQQLTTNGGLTLFLVAFLAVIVAPVVEEFAFRGMLYGALRSKMGVFNSCIISGGIFSVLHPTMPGQFIPLLVLGAGFALIREKTGSLLPSMICHAINNGVMLIAMTLMS